MPVEQGGPTLATWRGLGPGALAPVWSAVLLFTPANVAALSRHLGRGLTAEEIKGELRHYPGDLPEAPGK
jgi:hypothetical protein